MNKKIKLNNLIIWEDDNYMVINKPPFISTLNDRGDAVNILKIIKDEFEQSQVCHRLDKNTSGILIASKSNNAYRHMAIQFENRSVEKIYHAVSSGIHGFTQKQNTKKILPLKNGKVITDNNGKDSLTIFNTIATYKQHSLIECKPLTGRMHQIRVHLSDFGAPIVGDTKYGGTSFYLSSIKRKYRFKKNKEEAPLINRQALHSYQITFKDLAFKEITIKASYPKDFKIFLRQLEKNV